MDRSKYIEKRLQQLDAPNFKKLSTDTTKSNESKVQRTLLKIKNKVDKSTYEKIYPSGSNPGKFYGTGKIHKLEAEEITNVEKLPLRPIISNIGTATYETARYLCKLLAPLGKSDYTVSNTSEFVNKMRKVTVPKEYQMITFDVKSLFTNVPLEETIKIILDKIYEEKLISVPFAHLELQSLLRLCTKEVEFSFNEELYLQVDGVAMGSPLGPLLANIFMCKLENHIIPPNG